MATRYYANAPATTLTAELTAGATSMAVASVTGLPTSFPYVMIIDRGQATEEVVEVTAAAGTTLTVTRGADSTTAFAHSTGATVEHGISARDLREPNEHINNAALDHHTQYLNTTRHDTPARHGSAVVDHGSIGGLTDDDHPQYALADGTRGTFAAVGHTHSENVTRVLHNGSAYPARPAAATYVEWVGPTDPSLQGGLSVLAGDTWVQTA